MNAAMIYPAVICLLLASRGCSTKQNAAVRRKRPATRARKPHRQRHVYYVWGPEGLTRNDENRPQRGYIFYEWSAEGTEGSAVLEAGYGLMIYYDCWRPNAMPRFELYAHDRGTIVRTTSWTKFKDELSKIPPGQTLWCFDTCCCGTHSGLDRAIIERIAALCHDNGIVFVEGDDETICTCA